MDEEPHAAAIHAASTASNTDRHIGERLG